MEQFKSSVKICKKCKSLMINGRCTNKKCMATVVDIEHLLLENSLKRDHKNLNKLSLYANARTNAQSKLYNEDSIFDKYGFIEVRPDWFLFAKEKGIELEASYIMEDGDNPGGNLIQTIKQEDYKQVKRYIKYPQKYLISLKNYFSNGKSLKLVFGSKDGKYWSNLTKICNDCTRDIHGTPIVLYETISTIFDRYYKWSIAIESKCEGVKVNYFLHREQAYEIFKNREIKEGNKRRTALRHNVSGYTKEDGKLIKEYLRCDPTFEWNEMICTMVPPIKVQREVFGNARSDESLRFNQNGS